MEDNPPRTLLKKFAPVACLLVTGAFSSCVAIAQDQINLDNAIEEIDQLISDESFATAKEKLNKLTSVGIRDERIDMLNSRLKLFDSMDSEIQPIDLANKTGLSLTDEDQITATDLFDSLRVALENGEITRISEFSEPSDSTDALLQALFSNYTSMQVKLSETSKDLSSQSFFATLEFITLKTDNGDTAYPADAWKTHELRVTKSPGNWRKVRW